MIMNLRLLPMQIVTVTLNLGIPRNFRTYWKKRQL